MSQLLPRFSRRLQELDDARKVARVIAESGGEPIPSKAAAGATAPGDTARMRGLPIVGRGVRGVAAGTDPVAELLRSERRRGR